MKTIIKSVFLFFGGLLLVSYLFSSKDAAKNSITTISFVNARDNAADGNVVALLNGNKARVSTNNSKLVLSFEAANADLVPTATITMPLIDALKENWGTIVYGTDTASVKLSSDRMALDVMGGALKGKINFQRIEKKRTWIEWAQSWF